jgi:hypothetical protein
MAAKFVLDFLRRSRLVGSFSQAWLEQRDNIRHYQHSLRREPTRQERLHSFHQFHQKLQVVRWPAVLIRDCHRLPVVLPFSRPRRPTCGCVSSVLSHCLSRSCQVRLRGSLPSYRGRGECMNSVYLSIVMGFMACTACEAPEVNRVSLDHCRSTGHGSSRVPSIRWP